MCELLVRVRDKGVDSDPAKDAMISKRGHVIAIVEDAYPWTQRQLAAANLGADVDGMETLRQARSKIAAIDEGLARAVDEQHKQSSFLVAARAVHEGDTHPWFWSDAERTNPDWVIIRMPGVPASDVAMLTEPAVRQPKLPGDSPITVAARAWTLDLDAIPALKDVDGARNVEAVTVDPAAFDKARIRAPIDDEVVTIG